MKKAYLLLFLGFVFLGAAIFWGGKLMTTLPQRTTFAALQVETFPLSKVFLDGKELGQTPFENDKLSPGEYTLRLLPEAESGFSWERRIKLNPRLSTYVNYLFGPTESESTGEILTLEKIDKEKGELVVISDPDGARFSLDGQEEGVAPKILPDLKTGEHEIKFFLLGYRERAFRLKTWAGYKLLVNVRLTALPQEAPPVATASAGPKVKILETSTGWLRVRYEPTFAATEAAKVNPGDEYPLLEEKNDWFKILYTEDKEGWIFASYAQKLN